MKRFVSLTSLSVACLAVTVGLPAPASAASGDSFAVNTQFWDDPSPVVASSGVFAGCESTTDLSNGAEQIGPHKLVFFGDKLLTCPDGTVEFHYIVKNNFGRKTLGRWFVTASSLPGVEEGDFGMVQGDGGRCEVLEGSGGCILDTWTLS